MAAHRWLKISLVASLAAWGLSCSDQSGPGPVSMDRVGGRSSAPSFSKPPLLRPDGASEPAISVGLDGTMALSGLSWTQFFTNVWKAPFGSTPVFQGQIDAHIGKSIGGGDADLDVGSTGTLHATTLVFFFNPTFNALQLGVSAITCPNANTANDFVVSRSTDVGRSWTANKVFSAPLFTALNNVFPSLAVDPADGTLYAVWSDAHTVSLSRSGDQGATWSPALVVSSTPAATAVFPWVAALNGTVDVVFYGTNASSKDDPSAVWNVYLAQSTNGGTSFH